MLARERELMTHEIHTFNAFYGHDRVLKSHAGLPEQQPLKAMIEHGLIPVDEVPELSLRVDLPVYLCPSPRRARIFEKATGGRKKAVPIGPLIAYAAALAGPPDDQTRRRRLLVFPAHSSHFQTVHYDRRALLDALAAWEQEFDEVQVCLYWKDVLLGSDAFYRERGYDCVTAGHIFDPQFLFRLLEILRGASAGVTNQVGTHIVYSVALDRPIWFVPQEVDFVNVAGTPAGVAELWEREKGEPTAVMQALMRHFVEPVHAVTEEQRAAMSDFTGIEHVRVPRELRAILEEAETAYRRQVPRRQRLEDAVRPTLRRWRNRARRRARSLSGRA